MKYIAIFDIPDNYVIGSAVAKICPNDGKTRSDRDYENAYAQTEQLSNEKAEIFDKFNTVTRVLQDLGLDNAYDMPAFWCNDRKDYKVIPTKYHQGYMKALEDVEKEVRERFGFSERENVIDPCIGLIGETE